MKYLGMEFKNAAEVREYAKAGKINEYKKLVRAFSEKPIMELSSMISDAALALHDSYGMDWGEIEEIEIEAYKTT